MTDRTDFLSALNRNLTDSTALSGSMPANLRSAAGLTAGALVDLLTAKATASRAVVTDADGDLGSSSVTATELGYVSGVTSAIQTQINAKAASGANSDITSLAGLTTPLSVAQGGTGQDTLAELKTAMAFVKADVGLGNVDNTSDASKPISTLTQEALDLKAPLASPTFTGTPAVPTAAPGTNTTQAASTAFVRGEVAALVDASPSTLDTLNELAAALGDDPNFATTVTTALAGKEPLILGGTADQLLQGDKSLVDKADLPISTATQAALDLKLTTTDLDSTLAGKSAASAGISDLYAKTAGGALVRTPSKLIDLRDYGLSTAASAATNSAAVSAALTAAAAAKANLFLAEGEYACDLIQYANPGDPSQVSIFANPGKMARLVKDSADGNGLFQLSNAATTGFMAHLRFSNIVFEGYAGDSPFAFRAYDMVRTLFDNCQFLNADIGLDLLGGIGNNFIGCDFDGNETGVKIDSYVGYAGFPNLNRFSNCRMTDNSLWGVDFDNGRLLVIDTCNIEGNGTSGNASTGGLRVGANVGSENVGLVSPGLIATNTWFENNDGNASVQWASGENTLRDCYFVANPDATYDMYASGGRYYLDNIDCENAKTDNLYETSGVAAGNFGVNVKLTGKTIDTAKTVWIDKTALANFPKIVTPIVQGLSTTVQLRNGSNVLLLNAYTSGTPDSWTAMVAGGGLTGFEAASSAANADMYMLPKGTGVSRIHSPRLISKTAPASAADTGIAGEVRWDASYVYVCTATNTWKRVAIATW